MIAEHIDAKYYGMDYIIAGRMIQMLTGLIIEHQDNEQYDRKMAVWSVRSKIVDAYRSFRLSNHLTWKRRC